jgi:uncharacterized membrane protein
LTTLADSQTAAFNARRILLIDTLRGIALIAMASYHLTWDLEFFGYLDPGTATQGFFRFYARSIASSFLFLAGISLVLAHGSRIRWTSFWKRFAIVAGAALAISMATLIAFPQEWIYFGILHNIALSSLIGLAFLRVPIAIAIAVPILIAAAMIANASIAPGMLQSAAFDSRWLSWLGFAELPPRSNDYVPLFPWLAALLAGVAVARIALARGWNLPLANVQTRDGVLAKAGRHSLIVYLVHQPVLIGLVYLFSLVSPPPPPDVRSVNVRGCTAYCVQDGSEQSMCERVCGCKVDKLMAQSLLTPLLDGSVKPDDDRILALDNECAIEMQQTP